MTLLDRFRSQPPHKHPDVAVRLEYVEALPLDDRDAIISMAREDPDARVRRAAVAKLLDPAALGVIASSESDDSVRAAALNMLRDLASDAFEGTSEADSLAAVAALTDPRLLSQVAKTTPHATVGVRALSGLSDSHTLGSVSRHAVLEVVRVAALDALRARGDHGEILAVALNGEFKDSTMLAVEALTDREALDQVIARGRNKHAVRRARAIVREQDAEAAREAAHVSAQSAVQDARQSMSYDPPSSLPAPDETDRKMQDQQADAAQVAVDPAAEAAERDRQAAAQAAAEQARVAAAEEAAAAEARGQARLDELATAASAVVELEDLSAARRAWTTMHAEWIGVAGAGPVPEALTLRLQEASARLIAREAAAQEIEIKARREGLARMHNLLGRVEQLVTRPDLSLKAADRALRDIRAALAGIPPLPSRADFEDVNRRLKAAHEALAPKVSDLRETDEWQKWANVTLQEQLCAKMEALQPLDDPEAIAREVRVLQQQWRAAADVPRDKADALWRRFKAAHDVVWAKCEAHFAAEGQARAESLRRKTSLCEQVEALAESTSWIETAETIKKLQAEWKTIGPVSRGQEKAMWDRFRTACDRFFTRRHEDLARRKGVWAENLAKKDALCARAEALADSTEWETAAAEIKRLQAEWRAIGPVKKTRSEAIWQRFRAACDRFFDRYAHRHDTARAERVAAREALCAEIEALLPSDADAAPPADLLATVRTLRARWQQESSGRGIDAEQARGLDARASDAFRALLERWPSTFAGTDLDPEANQKRMEALVKKAEDLAGALGGPAVATDESLSPANRLAAMLKDALAANTIGGKSDDDSRFRAAAEEVRQLQSAWSRLGPVPEPSRRALADRFQRATRRITDRVEAAARSTGRPGPSTRPPGPSSSSGAARGPQRPGRPAGTETRNA
jgi:Domain of Unknown Function (DUF349)